MNIIFEGADASGKTTTLNAFGELLTEKKENFYLINELEESPLWEVLKKMFQADPFLLSNKNFKTATYETLVLAANHFYKQEFFRQNNKKIYVYDRDFMTVLAYQKYVLEREYGANYKKFYEPFKELMLFDLKPISTIAYLNVPIEVSIERIISRGREKPYTQQQIDFLKAVKENFEEELIPEVRSMGIDVLEIDGTKEPKENAEKIYKKVRG